MTSPERPSPEKNLSGMRIARLLQEMAVFVTTTAALGHFFGEHKLGGISDETWIVLGIGIGLAVTALAFKERRPR